MMLLQLFILALILLLLLRLAYRALHLIEPGRRVRRVLLRFFPMMEFAIWLWFVFRASSAAFSQYPYHNIVMSALALALVVVFGWYVLRDLVAGMVIKTESSLDKDQFLKTELASGRIKRLGYRSILLETDNGDKIRIPYSRLNKLLLHHPAEEETSHSHVIEMRVDRKYQAEMIKKDITSQLLNMPWVVTGFPPEVIVTAQDKEYFLVEIRFNVIKKDHVILVEENIKGYSGPATSQG